MIQNAKDLSMFCFFIIFTKLSFLHLLSYFYCFGSGEITSSIFPPPLSRYERFNTLRKGHIDSSYVPSVFSPKSNSINISNTVWDAEQKSSNYYDTSSISLLHMPTPADIVSATFSLDKENSGGVGGVRLRIPIKWWENVNHGVGYQFEINVRYQLESEMMSTTNNLAWGDVLKTDFLGISPNFSFFMPEKGQMSKSAATGLCQKLFIRELQPGFGSPGSSAKGVISKKPKWIRDITINLTDTVGHVMATEGVVSSVTTVTFKMPPLRSNINEDTTHHNGPDKATVHTSFNISFNCSCNGGAGVINLGMSGKFDEVLNVIPNSLQYFRQSDEVTSNKYASLAFTRPKGEAPKGVFLWMQNSDKDAINLLGGFQSGPRGAFCQRRTGICPSATSNSHVMEDVNEGNSKYDPKMIDSTYDPNPHLNNATEALRRALYSIDASLGEIYKKALLYKDSMTKLHYRPLVHSHDLSVSFIIQRIYQGTKESVDSSVGPARCESQVKYPYYRMTQDEAAEWPQKTFISLTRRVPSVDMGPYLEDCSPGVIQCHVSDEESVPIYVPITVQHTSKLPAYVSINISRRHVSLSCPLCKGGELSINYPVPFIPISILRKPTHTAAIFQYNIDSSSLPGIDKYLKELDSLIAKPITMETYEFYKPHVKIVSSESVNQDETHCVAMYTISSENHAPVCDIEKSCSGNGCCMLAQDTHLGEKYSAFVLPSFHFPIQRSPCMCFQRLEEGYYTGPECNFCAKEYSASKDGDERNSRTQKCIYKQGEIVIFLSELSTRAIAMTIPSLIVVCVFICISIVRRRWLSDAEFLTTKRRRVGLRLVDSHCPGDTHHLGVPTLPQRPRTSLGVVNRRKAVHLVQEMELLAMHEVDITQRQN